MRQPANPYMTSAVRGPGRRGKWISWSSEGCPHFQFPTPGMSPRPAHCSGRPPGPPRVTQPEKPEPRLSRASGHRKSKNRKRQCAVAGWKPSDLRELWRTGTGVNNGSQAVPASRPRPWPRHGFHKLTHTEPAQGVGRAGFPDGAPGGQSPASRAHERAPQRRRPKAPAALSLLKVGCGAQT